MAVPWGFGDSIS